MLLKKEQNKEARECYQLGYAIGLVDILKTQKPSEIAQDLGVNWQHSFKQGYKAGAQARKERKARQGY